MGMEGRFGLLGMLTFAFTLVSLALFLIEDTKLFASIKQPLPRNIGLRKVGLAISVACAIIFPLIILRTGAFGLTSALMGNKSAIFHMGRANRAFSVVVGLSVMGFLTLLLFIFTDGKKHKAKLCDYGLTTEGSSKLNWKLIGKSALLSLVVLFAGFAYLRLQRQVLGTDFYCLYFGYKPIAWNKFTYNIPYIICWILCFIMSSIGMNVERRLPDTGNEKVDTARALALNIVLNILTVTVVVFVQQYLQKHVLMRTGAAWGNWGADLTRLWGMPAGMTIAGFVNTYMYRKTGSIWPGVILGGALCALACVLYGAVGNQG